MEKKSNINHLKYGSLVLFNDVYFWITILIIFLVYSPAFLFDFGMHNDYSIKLPFYKLNAINNTLYPTDYFHPEYKMLHAIGRPFNAYLQNLQFHLISTLSILKLPVFFHYCCLLYVH